MTIHEPSIRVELLEDDSLLKVTLDRPTGNVIDRPMIASLRRAVRDCTASPPLRAILFTGEGPNFSFGASVQEHRPEEIREFLPAFHGLFRELAACNKVLIAAVRGYCLGGGLELAAFCHRVFASRDAQLGCPEIKLGVFAPIGSIVLPRRIGRPAADDLLITGRSVAGDEALALWLVDDLADDPVSAAIEWHREHLLPRSAVALGHAVNAARSVLNRDLETVLPRLERRYLEELMASKDAEEGIEAFLAKRKPTWRHE